MHRDRFQRIWPFLLFLGLAAIPLFPAIFFGRLIGPFDQIRQMAPWFGQKPAQPWDVLQADGVLQFYGWRSLVFEAWSHWSLPLWNPYILAGTPLLANSQSAGFYPPHILMGLLHVPVGLAMTLLAWFHLAWAGFGCYYLSRRLGASHEGGLLAGISFSLSAFMVSWAALPSVISTVAWIPWVLVFTIKSLDKEPGRYWPFGALSVAMMLLAGHLQFAAYGLLAAVLVAIVLFLLNRNVRSLARMGFIVIVGASMAAPQLLPVLNYSKLSHRANTPNEDGYAAYSASAIQFWEAGKIIFPSGQGLSTDPLPEDPSISAYWPAIALRGNNFAESSVGVGPFAFVLFLFACASVLRRRDHIGLSIIAVSLLGLLLAFGTFVGRLLYFGVPGWSASGSPGRASVLFVIGACALAGLAVPELKDRVRLRGTVLPGLGLLAAFAAIGLTAIAHMAPPPAGIDAATWQTISGRVSWILVLIPLIIGAALWIVAESKSPRTFVVGACACAVVALAPHLGVVRTASNADFSIGDASPTERYAFVNENWELLTAVPAMMPPNTAVAARVHDLGGYDSLISRETVGMLKEVNRQDSAPPANGNIMFVKPSLSIPALADAGVTRLWATKPIPELGAPEKSFAPGVREYEIPGLGRASTERGPAKIESESLTSISILAEGPGTLSLRDRNLPGWSASLDGKPAKIAPGLWRNVELNQGQHRIEFRYWPPGLTPGLLSGLLGWLIWALGMYFCRVKVKKT